MKNRKKLHGNGGNICASLWAQTQPDRLLRYSPAGYAAGELLDTDNTDKKGLTNTQEGHQTPQADGDMTAIIKVLIM